MTDRMLDAGSLDSAMVPMEDSPTVSMSTVGDPVLQWETRQEYHLAWSQGSNGSEGPGLWAFAHVLNLKTFRDRPTGKPWRAYCCGPRVPGPDPAEFFGWFATAEEAIAAVETHIAAHVDKHLNEVAW